MYCTVALILAWASSLALAMGYIGLPRHLAEWIGGEMAQITPPAGFNLFVLQGMTKRAIGWLARITLPFFFLMVAAVALIWILAGVGLGQGPSKRAKTWLFEPCLAAGAT